VRIIPQEHSKNNTPADLGAGGTVHHGERPATATEPAIVPIQWPTSRDFSIGALSGFSQDDSGDAPRLPVPLFELPLSSHNFTDIPPSSGGRYRDSARRLLPKSTDNKSLDDRVRSRIPVSPPRNNSFRYPEQFCRFLLASEDDTGTRNYLSKQISPRVGLPFFAKFDVSSQAHFPLLGDPSIASFRQRRCNIQVHRQK
jgi:hypothetical protein